MTPRQQAFIDAYLVNPSPMDAAIKAGYSPRTAAQMGFKVLRVPAVAEAIRVHREKLSAKSGLTAELLDAKLLALVNFDPRKMLGEDGRVKMPHEWDDETAAAVAGLENEELFEGSGQDREHIGTLRKVKIADRIRPLELGYKRLGLLRDQASFQVGALTIVIQD